MKTGFEKLDNIINSLNCGELTCIASRPGIGKTTFSIDIVNNISKQTDNKIIFISLENSKEQFEMRIKSDKVEIITDKILISDIEDVCRSLSYKYHYLSLIVIDYLQLIEPEIRRKDRLREKVDIIKSLKQLSIELNVPIIITSQLPRTDEKPKLEDLNVYGTTYHYSKVLMLYKDTDDNLKIEVVKNKGVSHRAVDLEFNNKTLSLEEKEIMRDKKLKLLSLLNSSDFYKNEKKFKLFMRLLNKVEFLLPFNDNNIVILTTEEDKTYIPIFTDENQIKDIEFTRLDKVKLEVIIRDIYSSNRYYAISINPYTNDFILNNELVKIFRVLNKI